MAKYIDKSALVAEIERINKKVGTPPQENSNGEDWPFKAGEQHVCHEIISIINTLGVKEAQEEPVSEDLEEAAFDYAEACKYDGGEKLLCVEHFKAGAKWQKEHLWKPADGEYLPEYEREVVVFTQDFSNDAGIMRIAIAHRPDPKGWDGKSITTGKVEHYTPKTYSKGGWNIPDVVLWLDLDIPQL